MSVLRGFLLGLCLILIPVSASARYADLGQNGSWRVGKYTLNNGEVSCQATQCTNQSCQASSNLILYGRAKDAYPFFIFLSRYEYPAGSKAILKIGDKSFALVNKDNGKDSSKKDFLPTSNRDAYAITVLLQKLSLTKGSKAFSVVDHLGNKTIYSANGTARAIERIHDSCGTGMP